MRVCAADILRMKTITTTLALLSLLLGAWHLRAPSRPNPIPSTSPQKTSAAETANASSLSRPLAQGPDALPVISVLRLSESASVISSPPQSSWAREIKKLKSLASHDPQAALTAATGLATREERDDAVMAVCIEIARRDPARAVALAWDFQRDQFDGPGVGTAFENLGRQWAAKDLSAALSWARAQPNRENDARRDHIFKGLVSTLSRTTPAEAARLVTEQIPTGAVQFSAAINVLDDWVADDFPMAAVWIGGLPDGGLREAVFEHLASMDSQRLPSLNLQQASPL